MNTQNDKEIKRLEIIVKIKESNLRDFENKKAIESSEKEIENLKISIKSIKGKVKF